MNRRAAERGFSLIELVIVLMIISLLLRIGLPAYDSVRRGAIAARAAGDVAVIRIGAAAQFTATGGYAPDAVGGVTPAGMGAYLPHDFSFRPKDYELDWENWTVADTSANPNGNGQILAVTVTAQDPEVGLRVLDVVGRNCTHWSVGNSHTFVVQSTLEAPH